MITVYTKNDCVQCKMTKNLLKNKNIKYMEINVEDNDSVRNRLKEQGIKQMPAVFEGSNFLFSGFQPSEVNKIWKKN